MAADELARRLRHEKQCLLGIPRALGGLVAAEGDELPFSFALEIRPAPDLCLRTACRFDVQLSESEYPGVPPVVRCATPWEHLPPQLHAAAASHGDGGGGPAAAGAQVDPMGAVRGVALLSSAVDDGASGWSRSYDLSLIHISEPARPY